MIYILLFCLPLLITALTPFGSAKTYLGKERRLQERNLTNNVSEAMTALANETVIYTSGYLRTDTFDWLGETWIQAEVFPIGQCFKDGSKGGSAQIAQVAIDWDAALRIVHTFESSDCSGDFTAVPINQPIVEVANQMDIVTRHVQDLDQALQLEPLDAAGAIITSFYSSDGCTGAPAQYNIVSDACRVYPDPVGAYGTITCDAEAEMMVLTMYGPYDADVFTYAACELEEYQEEFFAYYMFGYGYSEVEVVKQPFQCTDQTGAADDGENFPFFQTVRCIVPPVKSSVE